jgi:pimeloyl-ACP methyl ester carboxylesterase
LIGHDRGGWLAWMLAMHRPHLVRSLTVLAVPHPRRMRENLARWAQIRRSWYAYFLQLPLLPELLFRAAGHALTRRVVAANRVHTPIDERELQAYVRAAAQPGALTAMFNYYRANARAVFRRDPLWWAPRLPRIEAPTLVLWPTHDRYQLPTLAQPYLEDVRDLQLAHVRAGHWLHEDNPERANAEILSFLGRVEAPSREPVAQ